jgi:hypothetical protein
LAQIPLEAVLADAAEPPLYQQIARRTLHLRELGRSHRSIAKRLKVDEKTVAKAIRWTTEE